MKQFYEQELTDITGGDGSGKRGLDDSTHSSGNDTSREMIVNKKKQGVGAMSLEKRGMKKDPLEKAKSVITQDCL
jgi:hypothetical protein